MKIILKNLLLPVILILSVITTSAQAQERTTAAGSDLKVDFKGNFVVKFREDNVNNYFLADFTKLQGKFEKIWFMERVFASERIVSTDSDLTNDYLNFLSNKKYPVQEVIDEFNDLLENTKKSSSAMTDQEKSEWLKKNDKYK